MVKSTEELIEIRDEIYEKLYDEATPSADYGELVEKEESGEFDHKSYQLHYLEDERQIEIIEHTCEKHNLSNFNKDKLKSTVLLGSAPSGSLDKTNENREAEGLEPVEPEKEESEA